MASPNNFLTTPLWQAVRRTTRTLVKGTWERVTQNKATRTVLLIALVCILAYGILVGSVAYAIYGRNIDNGFTRFVETLFPYPAASVNGEIIPLNRYRTEVATRLYYRAAHGLSITEEETEQFTINQLIDRTLYKQALENNGIRLHEDELENKLQEIYEQVGGESKLAEFLQEQYGPEVSLSLFRTWMREAAIENAVQSELLTRVKVRHILISVPDNAPAEQVEALRLKGLEIKSTIADLTQFAEVARVQSEDVASRDKGGEFGTTNRGDETPVISPEFEAAIFTLPVGQVSEPVRSSFGWHLVIVEEKAGQIDLSKKAFTQQLRDENNLRIFIGE